MSIDKSAHDLLRYASDKESCFRYLRNEHIPCPFCRNELEATYCEERLYMIRCGHCKIIVLSEGKSPRDAAGKLLVTAKQDEEYHVTSDGDDAQTPDRASFQKSLVTAEEWKLT